MVAYSSEEYESSNGTRATDSGIGSIGRHESQRAFSSGLSSSAPPGTSVGDSGNQYLGAKRVSMDRPPVDRR